MAQDLALFYPELWADRTLQILRDQLVMGARVARTWTPTAAMPGDTVNIQLPGTMTANDLSIGGSVTVQTASVTNVQVLVNKHKETSFRIYDAETAKTAQDLIRLYLEPAMKAIAEQIEDDLQDEYTNFTGTAVGTYGTALADTDVLTMWQRLAEGNVPEPWTAVIHPKDAVNLMTPVSNKENVFLNVDGLPSETPLAARRAFLGNRMGIDFFRSNRVNKNTSTSPDEYHGLLFGPETLALASATFKDVEGFGNTVLQVNDSEFALRVEISRQADKKGMLVTVDTLYGVKTVRAATGFELKS